MIGSSGSRQRADRAGVQSVGINECDIPIAARPAGRQHVRRCIGSDRRSNPDATAGTIGIQRQGRGGCRRAPDKITSGGCQRQIVGADVDGRTNCQIASRRRQTDGLIGSGGGRQRADRTGIQRVCINECDIPIAASPASRQHV